ncbi:MAG: hypothetical protein HOC71_02790 [Candidatus Latescibacteria bacterium]|jgi:LmbE family N-acetylglucosaminyl deacetylase|nr:hypothetical protein [Candidatus Latescibacterota bacterium]
MARHSIFGKAAAGGALLAESVGITGPPDTLAAEGIGEVEIERNRRGKPFKGKVFAAVHAHLDDIPYFCAGTCAKLINEGYTGYLIRTSNDEKCGYGTANENIKSNEEEHYKMAEILGFSDVFDFYYRNHRMDGISPVEIRSRLIFLFRHLKVDTVLTFNPWGHGEENPDHWVTGEAVGSAYWMCAVDEDHPYVRDYEEHLEAGIEPHEIGERYYFVGRAGQPYNHVVDVSSYIEQKIDALTACKSQGGGCWGSRLRKKLAKEGKRLPILGNDDETADRAYVKQFMMTSYKRLGEQYGLEYAEAFLHFGGQDTPVTASASYSRRQTVEEYIKKHSVPVR